MKLLHFVWLGAVALGCFACDDDDDASALTLAVDNSTLTLAAGETKTARVTVKSQSDASMTLIGVPADVSASLDPQSTSAEAILTVGTTASTAAQTFELTVLAEADGASAIAKVSVVVGQPAAMTVTGKVVDVRGYAVAMDSVSVWGQGASTPIAATLASDGSFSASDVIPPYDVRAQLDDLSVLYLDLTIADPTLFMSIEATVGTTPATVSGNFGANAAPAGATTLVAAACPRGSQSMRTTGDTYSMTGFSGTVAEGDSCNASALRVTFDESSGNPASWLATQTQAFTASLASDVTVDFELGAGPLASHDVTMTFGASPNSNVSLTWTPDDAIAESFILQYDAPFALPDDVSGFALVARGVSYSSGTAWMRSLPLDASTTSAAFDVVPQIAADGAGPGSVTTLNLVPFASAPVSLFCQFSVGGPQWIVSTNAGGIDYARLASRGMTGSSDATFYGQCLGVFSHPSTDAWARESSPSRLFATGLVARLFPVGAVL